MGDLGARLQILKTFLKNQKISKDNKKIIPVIIETESAHVLDVLQYLVKRAQFLIEKATEEGRKDEQAEQDYANALKHIDSLKKYLKDLSIPQSKIFSIDLPSDDWIPKQNEM